MIAVGVIDVGTEKKIGWSIPSSGPAPIEGSRLNGFVEAMAAFIRAGPVAIGFEAPLFIPVGRDAGSILKQRQGEAGRPWSAGAGATVTTAALGVVTYVLDCLRAAHPQAHSHVDWTRFTRAAGQVLFFEAFVTNLNGPKTAGDHIGDARRAAQEAARLLAEPEACASAIADTEVLSTLGAMLLRTSWSQDLALLRSPCLVVAPRRSGR